MAFIAAAAYPAYPAFGFAAAPLAYAAPFGFAYAAGPAFLI